MQSYDKKASLYFSVSTCGENKIKKNHLSGAGACGRRGADSAGREKKNRGGVTKKLGGGNILC